MITVKDDNSYMSEVDFMAFEKCVAKLGIHSIRFSNHLTEEQKKENVRMFEILTPKEWSESCENNKKEVGNKIEKIIDVIAQHFKIYQYKDKTIDYSKDNWDLFFWCNSGDMSYVTLNPNEKKRTVEQQVTDIQQVLELVKDIECEGIQVHIQYKAFYDEDKLKNILLGYCESIKDKMIEYHGAVGKIKEVGIGYDGLKRYGFFKKGASKKYSGISNDYILHKVLA